MTLLYWQLLTTYHLVQKLDRNHISRTYISDISHHLRLSRALLQPVRVVNFFLRNEKLSHLYALSSGGYHATQAYLIGSGF